MSKSTKKTLVSLILTIVLCLSVITGATLALFTSDDSVNIAVTSGKVELVASIDKDSLVLSSLGVEQNGLEFATGGTASFDEESDDLVLTNIVPGDKATFEIDVTNNSTVDVVYKLTWTVDNADMDALAATATVGDTPVGATATEWTRWSAPENDEDMGKTIDVSVELPFVTGNDHQAKSARIAFKVEAVQGNAGDLDLESAFEKGGLITTSGVPVSVDEIIDEETGAFVGGIYIGENDTTLKDIVINKTVAGDNYALCVDSDSGDLTLDSGTVINAGQYYGLAAVPGSETTNITVNEGSKISASGEAAACIYISAFNGDQTNLYLNASGLLDPQNGAKGIWIVFDAQPINIYVKDMAAYNEYSAMTKCETGGNNVKWYVNGILYTAD